MALSPGFLFQSVCTLVYINGKNRGKTGLKRGAEKLPALPKEFGFSDVTR